MNVKERLADKYFYQFCKEMDYTEDYVDCLEVTRKSNSHIYKCYNKITNEFMDINVFINITHIIVSDEYKTIVFEN